jgi:pimeloyl-ACP methyl ester carboxylesterase
MWRDVPDAVCHATGCPGVIYERPGYGASDPRPVPWPDNIFEQEAEIVLPTLLDKLGIDRPVLIGHSDGGTIALLCAAAFPARVLRRGYAGGTRCPRRAHLRGRYGA